jgi:hypothetical protein
VALVAKAAVLSWVGKGKGNGKGMTVPAHNLRGSNTSNIQIGHLRMAS